jgi:hypothetical protein
MPPKTTFSIPLGDVDEVVTQTRRSKRGLHTTQKEVPFHSSKPKKSGQSLRSRPQAVSDANEDQAQTYRQISDDTEESHPLHTTDIQEDDLLDDLQGFEEDIAVEEMQTQSNVAPRHLSELYNI